MECSRGDEGGVECCSSREEVAGSKGVKTAGFRP